MGKVHPSVGGKPQRLHKTVDVPQANRLSNIRELVQAVRDDINNVSALGELLGVDQRHFAYYRQAAVILDFLRLEADEVSLTARGQSLVATPEGSESERNCFRQAILDAPSLKPFSSFFESAEISVDELTHRLGVLTGLSHSTAKRRAQTLIQWRKYICTGTAPTTKRQLDLPVATDQLERHIARHNALCKQRYLEWLLTISPSMFEELVGQLIEAMGFFDVHVVGQTGDGGVDVRGKRRDEWGHVEEVVVQVKRHAKSIGRPVIDQMVGVLARSKADRGIIVTSSDFTPQALSAAKQHQHLRLVNGPQLVNFLARHGIGLKHGKYGELEPAEGQQAVTETD